MTKTKQISRTAVKPNTERLTRVFIGTTIKTSVRDALRLQAKASGRTLTGHYRFILEREGVAEAAIANA